MSAAACGDDGVEIVRKLQSGVDAEPLRRRRATECKIG